MLVLMSDGKNADVTAPGVPIAALVHAARYLAVSQNLPIQQFVFTDEEYHLLRMEQMQRPPDDAILPPRHYHGIPFEVFNYHIEYIVRHSADPFAEPLRIPLTSAFRMNHPCPPKPKRPPSKLHPLVQLDASLREGE